MAQAKRCKTRYSGVFYRETERIGMKGTEKVFYIVFKKEGKVFEEKVGRQFADNMTEAKAAGIRAERIEGKRASRRRCGNKKPFVRQNFRSLRLSGCGRFIVPNMPRKSL